MSKITETSLLKKGHLPSLLSPETDRILFRNPSNNIPKIIFMIDDPVIDLPSSFRFRLFCTAICFGACLGRCRSAHRILVNLSGLTLILEIWWDPLFPLYFVDMFIVIPGGGCSWFEQISRVLFAFLWIDLIWDRI